jgi:ubiquinone/menaquinone biosynthesis C-methylase UbiE
MELERFMPGADGEIWYEHWHRYHFAAPLVRGLQVLDIACGEGYGSALLASSAAHVIGVDAAADIVAHARRRYGALPNIEFRDGRCEAIPAPDSSIDAVVSFETIEHIPAPEKLVDEALRVVRPEGLFIVSTPNKEIYSDRRGYRNEFHLREMYRDEFVAILRARFAHIALFGQRVDAYSAIWPEAGKAESAQLLDARRNDAHKPQAGVADAMYYLAVCGREAAAVEAASSRFSLLSDRDHFIFEDYAKVYRTLKEVEAHIQRIESAYQASQQQIAALAHERDQLAARLKQLEIQATAQVGWRRT